MASRPPDSEQRFEDEDAAEESIEVSGVPLVVWAARLSILILVQALIVLASYAYYGFGTDPAAFGPGFRLDPIHASINLLWGSVGSLVGFFMPRFSTNFVLAFALFYTALAGLGTFTSHHFGMKLDVTDNLMNWLLALGAWAAGIYSLINDCREQPPEAPAP
jgi:hypothetical protein